MRRRKGVVVAEAAVILPIFIFLILASLNIVWAIDQRANLDSVARNVAGCIHNTGCSDPQAAALNFANGLRMPNAQSILVTSQPPACSTCTTVTVTYTYQGVGPFFRTLNMTTTASSD